MAPPKVLVRNFRSANSHLQCSNLEISAPLSITWGLVMVPLFCLSQEQTYLLYIVGVDKTTFFFFFSGITEWKNINQLSEIHHASLENLKILSEETPIQLNMRYKYFEKVSITTNHNLLGPKPMNFPYSISCL